MNGPDPFEEKLRRQPFRPLPAAWRNEILATARRAATETAAANDTAAGPRRAASISLAALRDGLSNLLWPHPIAWGGLAATWLLIMGLNLASRDPIDSRVANQSSPPSPELRQLLREQEQMFAELIGPVDKSAAVEPKRRGAQPRSQARPQLVNV